MKPEARADKPHIITIEDFAKVDIRVGTIVAAKKNAKAVKPAYVLQLDFGDYGLRTSSAQLTENYVAEELLGRQVLAVINFPPRLIAGVKSEVLVLAAVCPKLGTVLIKPDLAVGNGARVL